MKLEEQIGNKIRNLRNQNGLTQQELADRSDLTKGFISQVERGFTAPSVATLADIIECLGSNLADFFNDEEDPQIVYKPEECFEKVDKAGSVKLYFGEKVHIAEKGDSFYYQATKRHKLEAAGKTEAKVLWISTPPSF